jgi:translation initiation factor 2 alpha subunit (eIF-2alpha)
MNVELKEVSQDNFISRNNWHKNHQTLTDKIDMCVRNFDSLQKETTSKVWQIEKDLSKFLERFTENLNLKHDKVDAFQS